MTNPLISQFAQTPVQGQLDLLFKGGVLSVQADAAVVTPLVAGQAVKMATTAGGVPKMIPLAANSDAVFGFVARNVKDQNFPAYAYFELGFNNSVMFMTAGAAITRGSKIEVVYTTNKVITNAGTNPVTGFALDTAANDGDLIRVYILTPGYELGQSISDISGLQEALNNANAASARSIVALTTAGAGTITAAGLFAGHTQRSGPTAAFTDTTDTGTALAALFTGLTVNDSVYYTYFNNTVWPATIAGGVGVTPSIQTVINGNSWVKYLLTYTGTNTWTMVAVESGQMNLINPGAKVCTAQVDKTSSTALGTITGCSVPLVAGGKYIFEAHITGVATANGGMKAAIAGDGTLSATTFSCTGTNFNTTTTNAQSTTTTLGTAVGAATAAVTDMYLEGAIVVNAAGILNLQFAQNASHADTSSAYVNSFLKVTRVA